MPRKRATSIKSDEFLRNWVEDYFAKRPKTRIESISYLVDQMLWDGVRFPTRHSDAMDAFEKLGFKLHSDRNQYGALLRTYVLAPGKET